MQIRIMLRAKIWGFKSEEAIFEDIIDDLGLKISGEIVRHPLAYLVEAADDICYTIIDFEDELIWDGYPKTMLLNIL